MTIKIHLTRNNDSKNDDIITIRKRQHHSDFLIRYNDGILNSQIWIQTKTLNEIMIYLRRVFMYLNKERDPFSGIQCNIPGYPVLYLPIPEFLEDIQISVLDSIYETLSNPPSMFIE